MSQGYIAAPNPPIETQIYEADGVWLKQIVVPKANTYLPQHSHVLGHLTMVAKGTVNVWENGEGPVRHEAPSGIYIKAGVKHLFETLADDVVLYCIHSLATDDALRVLAEHELLG